MTDMLSGGGVLVGRAAERQRLEALVDAVLHGGAGPAGVVVRGEPGIGRTAMLAEVAEAAEAAGTQVLTLRGVAAEHGLTHGALTDLLLPLRPHVAGLAPVQRSMLLACLALRPPLRPGPADELAVCAGTHAVLVAAAARAPLLVVVDDVQWVDPASRRVLLYVARRLAGDRVAVLLAHRDAPGGAGLPPDLDGLPALRLGGLGEEHCAELVRRAGGTAPPDVALAAVTGGNPQALLDGLAADRWQPLDLGPALRGAWSAALLALPPRTRTALTALTTAPSASPAELVTVLAGLRLGHADLEPARRAGLLPAAPGGGERPHPLLAAAVRATVPAAVRGRVARVLAAHADGDLHNPAATGSGLRTAAATVGALVLAGREPEARAALPAAVRRASADPWELLAGVLLAQSLVWLEDTDAATQALAPVLDVARTAGAAPVLAHALVVRAELEWQRGAWAASHAAAAEALLRAGRGGAAAGPALAALARVDAARGDGEQCRERLERAVRAAVPGRVLPVRVPAVHGLAALGAGDVDTAVAHLEQAWARAEQDGLRGADAITVAADLAEAWVRAGRPERAAAPARWLEERAEGSGMAAPAAAAARCRALLAGDAETAERWFAAAHRAHEGADLPFEHARTLLLEGETLRRLRRPAAARAPLRAAAARFTVLGARPWAARAELELGATGARAVADPEMAVDVSELSPQELRIARTVAGGLNNAEAAAALYLSRKTVEAHLTRIYRKLGVRSRTDLVRRLG